jgi:hypothetical protein
MVQGDVVFMLVLWTVTDFHAYPGYESTHKRGMESRSSRISRVFRAHKRGSKASYHHENTMFASLPCSHPVLKSLHPACSNNAKKWKYRRQLPEGKRNDQYLRSGGERKGLLRERQLGNVGQRRIEQDAVAPDLESQLRINSFHSAQRVHRISTKA